MTMKVGFTGTQNQLTKAQTFMLARVLDKLSQHQMVEFHHGDCVGADAKAHDLVVVIRPKVKIVIHPPLKDEKRAFCAGDEERPTKDYLDRDQDIVNECHVLVACPKGKDEEQRSGTWATVRRARAAKKSIWFIFPDGMDKIEEGK
jgi:hypothetical protein